MALRPSASRSKHQGALHLLETLRDLVDDQSFEQKRHFLRQLGQFSRIGRGEQIRQISLRRKQRTLKLLPFLILSCHKLLARREISSLHGAFEAVLLQSIEGQDSKVYKENLEKSMPQSSYHIAEGNSFPQDELDVSKNLVGNFEQESFSLGPDAIREKHYNKMLLNGLEKTPHQAKKPTGLGSDPKRAKMASNITKPTAIVHPRSTGEGTARTAQESKTAWSELSGSNNRDKSKSTQNGGRSCARSTNKLPTAAAGGARAEDSISEQLVETSRVGRSTSRVAGKKSQPAAIMRLQAVEAVCKLLMRLESRKLKEHYSHMIGHLKKPQQLKLRRVASTYKRRHLMAVEKKLSWLRSQLLKVAFTSIKKAKKSEVSKEMQSLKQLFMVGCFEHILKLHSIRGMFRQLMLLKSSQGASHFDSARSDLYFQSVQAGEFSVLGSKKLEGLPTILRKTSDTIKGHKRAKRHLAISAILLRLLQKPYTQLKIAGFKEIQLRATKVKVIHSACVQLEQVLQQRLQRQLKEGLHYIQLRAQELRAKHLAYMTDVMAALFKKRVLAPTFHYLKLEVARIDRHNQRLISLLCQSVQKILQNNLKCCKQETLTALKANGVFAKPPKSALASRQVTTPTGDYTSRPLCKNRSGFNRNRAPERTLQKNSTGLTARGKSTAKLAEAPKLHKEESNRVFTGTTDGQTHQDQTSVNKHSEGHVLKPLQQELMRSTRLLNALMAAEESFSSRSKARKPDGHFTRNTKGSGMAQQPKSGKHGVPATEVNKENQAPQSAKERQEIMTLSRNPDSNTSLAQQQFQPVSLLVPGCLPQRVSADNKRPGKQDFFSFQKKAQDESHKPANAKDCKALDPPVTQFCADIGPRHDHSNEKRPSRVDYHGGPSSSEHRTQKPIAESQTHIPALPSRRRVSVSPSSRLPDTPQGTAPGHTQRQPLDSHLTSAAHGLQQHILQRSTSGSRVSARQTAIRDTGRPWEELVEDDDCDVISHLTIVPIQPHW